MWQYIKPVYNWVMRAVYGFDKQEWLVILVVVTIAGFFLLRGFGSRKTH